MYGWLAVNYLMGSFSASALGDPKSTVVAIDVGGASAQYTMALANATEAVKSVTVNGKPYHLFTESYLGLGIDQARYAINATTGP